MGEPVRGAGVLVWVASVLVVVGCSPEPSDGVAPEVSLSQVGAESVAVFASSVPATRATVPVPVCADGRPAAAGSVGSPAGGTVWEVSEFPIRILVAAADPASIERLELAVDGGLLSSPDPLSVEIRNDTVAGLRIQRAEIPAFHRRGRPVRWFHVLLDLRPGSRVARLEVTARDGGGVESEPVHVVVGSRDALCAARERF